MSGGQQPPTVYMFFVTPPMSQLAASVCQGIWQAVAGGLSAAPSSCKMPHAGGLIPRCTFCSSSFH